MTASTGACARSSRPSTSSSSRRPRSPSDGHVNVSPKGLDGTFAVLGEHSVAYLDLTGSGSETVAHLRENGRITVMFCAFEGAPNIVRLHGTGRYVALHDAEFASYRGLFADHPGARGIVVIDVQSASPTRAGMPSR